MMVAALAALAVGSCAHKDSEVVHCADFVMSPTQYTAQIRGRFDAMSNEELGFVCRAAAYGRAQMIYAGMAERRATAVPVRRLAGQTLEVQRALNQQLEQVAIAHEGLTPPPGLEPAQIAGREALARLSDGGFDRAYLRRVVEDGRAAIALFRAGSVLPQPPMSAFAGAALPALEQRVRAAEGLLRDMEP
jgi:predicted outer membrane protein